MKDTNAIGGALHPMDPVAEAAVPNSSAPPTIATRISEMSSDDFDRGYAAGLAAARAFAEALAGQPESVGRERVALTMMRLDVSLQVAIAVLAATPAIIPDPSLPLDIPHVPIIAIH
ncbi:hypothetical protein C3941_00155 [Kaistia algarum]|uniref:hypothetical protein n=1 Tax=Kaistia algarum TaxID=2083279 RepID=UPI000CE786E3|nr:hypothetical protein [Kaistia algarum]MCX5513371.1 hypothetical protein [Kaistia algarum]PPE81180.1 hypothetical protein C3941_00155 [Kaistia algarum]